MARGYQCTCFRRNLSLRKLGPETEFEQTCRLVVDVFLFSSDTQTVGQLVVLALGLVQVLDVLVVALPPWNTQHM